MNCMGGFFLCAFGAAGGIHDVYPFVRALLEGMVAVSPIRTFRTLMPFFCGLCASFSCWVSCHRRDSDVHEGTRIPSSFYFDLMVQSRLFCYPLYCIRRQELYEVEEPSLLSLLLLGLFNRLVPFLFLRFRIDGGLLLFWPSPLDLPLLSLSTVPYSHGNRISDFSLCFLGPFFWGSPSPGDHPAIESPPLLPFPSSVRPRPETAETSPCFSPLGALFFPFSGIVGTRL